MKSVSTAATGGDTEAPPPAAAVRREEEGKDTRRRGANKGYKDEGTVEIKEERKRKYRRRIRR